MAYKEQYPSKLLEEAVDAISSLPGVGRRSALRLALHLLKQPAENVHHFTSAINALRDDVMYCSECMMIADAPSARTVRETMARSAWWRMYAMS